MDAALLRALPAAHAKSLPAGSGHYRSYVGPPEQYDLMGASQFMLLLTLGLRETHRVLDFGCGSLRAGRLLIPYLEAGHYHGLDPNAWLIEDAVLNELGHDLVALKQPRFHGFDDFRADRCGTGFDFILAQAVFSHAGGDIIRTALDGFRLALSENGLALATVLHPGQDYAPGGGEAGWRYPYCVAYEPRRFADLIADAGLHGRRLPWFHPRQTWYALARRAARLPPRGSDRHLRGSLLDVPDWQRSRAPAPSPWRAAAALIRRLGR